MHKSSLFVAIIIHTTQQKLRAITLFWFFSDSFDFVADKVQSNQDQDEDEMKKCHQKYGKKMLLKNLF